MAIMASWLTSPHYGKHPISAEKYLKQLEPKEKKKTTAEESKTIISELVAEMRGD